MKQVEIVDDIYEAAEKIAAERNESVQTLFEQMVRKEIASKRKPSDIIGLFADEPEIVDEMMEAIYKLRERPYRLPDE